MFLARVSAGLSKKLITVGFSFTRGAEIFTPRCLILLHRSLSAKERSSLILLKGKLMAVGKLDYFKNSLDSLTFFNITTFKFLIFKPLNYINEILKTTFFSSWFRELSICSKPKIYNGRIGERFAQ